MSDGAMMSQPASACTSACLHQHLDRLVVDDVAVAHQAVMAVAGVGVERDIAQDADLRHRLLDRADGAADEIVRVERFGAVVVAQASGRCRETARGTGCRAPPRALPRAPPRRPRAARRPASRRTGCALASPSMTNSGQIRSSAVSTFSRTIRRAHSALRLRRMRTVRSSGVAAGASASTGAKRARDSIGRPYLMAIGRLQERDIRFLAALTGGASREPTRHAPRTRGGRG